MKTRPIFLVVLMSITCFIGFAQIEENNRSNLSIEKIMQDPVKWIGSLPEDIHWDETGKYIFFNWNPEGNTLTSLYKYSFSSGKTEKVPPSEKKILPERNGSYNHNKSLKVFIRNGNLFLLDIRKGTEKQLSTWPENISSAKFALNDTHVSFMKDQNLFLLNLSTGTATQVIQFVQEEKKTESKPDEQAQWLSRQQLELFDVLKERKAAEKAREKRDEEMKPVQPEKYTWVKTAWQMLFFLHWAIMWHIWFIKILQLQKVPLLHIGLLNRVIRKKKTQGQKQEALKQKAISLYLI
jgi:hypothetical protein